MKTDRNLRGSINTSTAPGAYHLPKELNNIIEFILIAGKLRSCSLQRAYIDIVMQKRLSTWLIFLFLFPDSNLA